MTVPGQTTPYLSLDAPPAAPSYPWLIVARHELRDIWLSARGPAILVVFSLLLSVLTYLVATNRELNILDQKNTVGLVVQITLGIGVAVSLLFSADSISGERERQTLESLLLAPVPRRQLALGKLVAAVSIWPPLMVVSVPYIFVLRGGSALAADAILSGLLVGSLLSLAFASLGLLVSIFSSSNRLSLVASFFVFVVLLAPTQLPLSGWFGDIIVRVNPVTAGARFADRVITAGHGWGQEAPLLVSPLVAAVAVTSLALAVAGTMRLQGGIDR